MDASGDEILKKSTRITDSTQWNEYTVPFTLPEGTAELRAWTWVSGGAATTWFDDFTFKATGPQIMINDALVTIADVEASNGVVHVINAVLLPETSLPADYSRDPAIKLYPNPADDLLNIESTGRINMLTILDVSGSLHMKSGRRSAVDVSDLKPGIYILKVNTTNGTHIRKFIKR